MGWGIASGPADPVMGTPGPWVESALLCGWGAPFLRSKVRMGEVCFPGSLHSLVTCAPWESWGGPEASVRGGLKVTWMKQGGW